MAQHDREVEPFFSQPIRQIAMMLVVLVAFGVGAYVAYPRVAPVFLSNPYLNGFILFVFVIGLISCLWQVLELIRSVSWIMAFVRENRVPEGVPASRLLAPLAALMRSRGARTQISSTSARSIQDSVATRIDEARDITRYITSLLIFLGLLGTFYGLSTTVPAVVETIRSLAPKDGEGAVEVFGRLMGGLEGQLGGMGTAFASSLLGLAGSLVIGLLELFANHGQNRFYRELEEWLSSITRLGFAGADEGGADSGLVAALAEHLAEQMDVLQTLFANSEAASSQVQEQLVGLSAALDRLGARMAEAPDPVPVLARIAQGQERLADRMAVDSDPLPILTRIAEGQERLAERIAGTGDPTPALARIAEGQERLAERIGGANPDLAPALARVAEGQERLVEVLARQAESGGAASDAESRMRLRSIDVQLLRILEEISAGRQESLTELRGDLATVIKTLRQHGSAPAGPAQARRG